MSKNLFVQLEKYAKENFTTETLAYLLKTDDKFLSEFLQLLFSQSGKKTELLKLFRVSEINTQAHYKKSIIDLEIISTIRQDKRILVEIKTQSDQSHGQIQKYLKLPGFVAYLTPLGHAAPSLQGQNGNFLGHFNWNEICTILRKTSGRKSLQNEFIKYLEARNMGELQPITNAELKSARLAVDFINKSQGVVQKILRTIEKDWSKKFGRNIGIKSANPGFDYGDANCWWYRAPTWRRGKIFLELGIAVGHVPRNTPAFYVGFGASSKSLRRYFEHHLSQTLKKLRGQDWVLYPEEWAQWGYRKYYSLGSGQVDDIAKRHTANARSAVHELQKLHVIKRMKCLAKEFS